MRFHAVKSWVVSAACELCGKPNFKIPKCKYATSASDLMNVFDRKAKLLQRNRAAAAENFKVFDYLKDEASN